MKIWHRCLVLFALPFIFSPHPAVALDCAKQQEAQVAFMLSPLSEKKTNIARGEKYTEEDLLWAFGLPDKIESKAYESQRDGRYVIRTWYFKGLTITAQSYDQYWVSEVNVYSPEIELKCSLRIGHLLSDFVATLGKPKGEKSGAVEFALEYPEGYHPEYQRWLSAQIWLGVRNGRVERLRWIAGPGH